MADATQSIDPAIKKIFNAGKRSAIARKNKQLDLEEILDALAFLREDPEISPAIENCLGHQIIWDNTSHLFHARDDIPKVTPEEADNLRLPLGTLFKAAYGNLRENHPSPSLAEFLQAMLKGPEIATRHSSYKFLEATPGQKQGDSTPPRKEGFISRLRKEEERASKLRESLKKDVIGQDEAIVMLSEGYLGSIRKEQPSGLRCIFTFLGPPGVGKTMLAERFAAALTEVERERYDTTKISMEAAGDQETLIATLFGVQQAYKGSSPGLLHDRIAANPRQVIIFDEIEKAPSTIIQSLLTLLESGKFTDRHENDPVDLSRCFVVFTTNLGQDIFASRNRSGILRGSSFTSDDLFDLLSSAKRREAVHYEDAPSALAPEFVSRLRKGRAVLFNQLTGSDYLRLIDTVTGNAPPPHFYIGPGTKEIFLLSLLPDISPRRLTSECAVFHERLVRESIQNCPDLVAADPDKFTIIVGDKLESESETIFDQIKSDQQLELLILDNDNRMSTFIERYKEANYGETKPSVSLIRNPSEIADAIVRNNPDIVLIDLDLPELNQPGEGFLRVHRDILRNAPEIPIVFFSESSECKEKVQKIMNQGGARAFFSFKQVSDEIQIEDEHYRFSTILSNVLLEKMMKSLIRSRRSLDLEIRYEYVEYEGRKKIDAYVTTLKPRQVVSMADGVNGFSPAEIPDVTFDDVYGLARAKERLQDAISFMKDPAPLRAFGVKPPSGFLLAGPSGTGKTHIARAVANAADCVFYALSAGELESKWAGEGEERIRKLFVAARRYAPAVIFIDEIDAIAGNRSASSGSANGVKMLNQLLVCMDGFSDHHAPVLILAATNRPESLDPAILRPGRFDETIRIEPPDAKARQEMFSKRLEGKPIDEEVKQALPRLVCRTAGMSPAQLDRILREACYLAVRDNRTTLSLADLEAACNLVRYGANRRDIMIPESEKRQTAWHEAGHAVAHLSLFPDDRLDFVSIIPNEQGALGFASWRSNESRHTSSIQDFRNRIVVALAGREGERLCPGAGDAAINTGASSDYEQATSLAWQAVSTYGFDETYGTYNSEAVPASVQSSMALEIKPRVDELLKSCLEKTRELLKTNAAHHSAIAEALVAKEALEGEEVERLWKVEEPEVGE